MGLDRETGTRIGDVTLDMDTQDIMQVKVIRVVDENLSVVLPSLLESELHTANVVLLLDNQTVLKAHKCFLSASPVLKEVLMSLEARLDKLPHISMPGFSKDCVVSFLHFLYKGFVVLENFNIQQEFLGLCRSLKVNPPVAKDGGATSTATNTATASAVPKQVVQHNPAFSDLSDDDMVIEEVEEAQESVLDEEQQAASAKVQEPESDALLEVEKDTNSNLLIREPQMSEKDHFVETDGIPASLPSVSDSEKKSVKVRQDVAKNVSKVASVQKSSIVSSQNVETIPSSSVPDPELGPICDNLEHLVNNNSPPAYESLANLVTPTEDEYDDETTEHISDFLNLLNTKSLNEKKAQEEKDIEEEEEEESFDTFKMPDSFDIPQDYIKEIVPYSSASATPFQVSDEE